MMTCEMNDFEIRVKFVVSPDVIFCGWLGSKHQLTNLLQKIDADQRKLFLWGCLDMLAFEEMKLLIQVQKTDRRSRALFGPKTLPAKSVYY